MKIYSLGALFTVTAVKTSNYSVQFGECAQMAPSTGDLTATLPKITAESKGRAVMVTQRDPGSAHNVSVAPSCGDTYALDPGPILITPGQTALLALSDGVSNWLPIAFI